MVNKLRMLTGKSTLGKRLVLGFAGVTTAAVVGSAGVAAAHPASKTMYLQSEAQCATQWQAFKFKNRGQCEAYWKAHAHQRKADPQPRHGNGTPGGGSGYGGTNIGVVVNVEGDNNVINIIINIFR